MRSEAASHIEVFDYPIGVAPLSDLWGDLVEVGVQSTAGDVGSNLGCSAPDVISEESSTASALDQARRDFEAGREQGIREGREAEVRTQSDLLRAAEKQGAEQAAQLAGQFAAERDRFLETMEQEVARLALAIAARILRREAQIDPLFMLGAVRVALGQLARTLQVRLHVPASEASLWAETLEHVPNLKIKPVVVPSESMQAGDCSIESDMGSVDLGLASQLHQMECALVEERPDKRGRIRPSAEPNREEMQA